MPTTTSADPGHSAYGPVRPNHVIEHTTWPGCAGETVSNDECSTTSAAATKDESSVTLRLFQLRYRQPRPRGGNDRAGDPPTGSTFTTSAPRSASNRPHSSPTSTVRSSTRMPSSGSVNGV